MNGDLHELAAVDAAFMEAAGRDEIVVALLAGARNPLAVHDAHERRRLVGNRAVLNLNAGPVRHAADVNGLDVVDRLKMKPAIRIVDRRPSPCTGVGRCARSSGRARIRERPLYCALPTTICTLVTAFAGHQLAGIGSSFEGTAAIFAGCNVR